MQTEELMANVSSDFIDIVNDYRHPDNKSDADQIKEKDKCAFSRRTPGP